MKELINRNIIPLVFKHGSVGASGDLVQLAHLALVLIGEGEVFYQGKRSSTAEVFKKRKTLSPTNTPSGGTFADEWNFGYDRFGSYQYLLC